MTDNDYEYSLGFDDGLAFGKHNADTEIARLREALVDCALSLVAAHSLLSCGGKKAAASDKMFEQMLKDYQASIERARAALGDTQ